MEHDWAGCNADLEGCQEDLAAQQARLARLFCEAHQQVGTHATPCLPCGICAEIARPEVEARLGRLERIEAAAAALIAARHERDAVLPWSVYEPTYGPWDAAWQALAAALAPDAQDAAAPP
jgi:hypothetical protein